MITGTILLQTFGKINPQKIRRFRIFIGARILRIVTIHCNSMSVNSNVPEFLVPFETLLKLLPQLAISATVISMMVLLLVLSPREVFSTIPIFLFLIYYWFRKVKELKE